MTHSHLSRQYELLRFASADRSLSCLIASIAMVLSIGSGFYIVIPSVSYFIVLFAFAVLLSDGGFRAAPFLWFSPERLVGALLLIIIFLSYSVFFPVDGRQFLTVINASISGIVSYALWSRVIGFVGFDDRQARRPVVYCALLGLALLLAGQFAELLGYLDIRGLSSADREDSFIFRPGGFHNPNMTAAIALTFFFVVYRVSHSRGSVLLLLALVLAAAVTLLSQSRAAIGILVLFGSLIVSKNRKLAITFFFAAIAFVIVADDVVVLLLDQAAGRFRGDSSSDDRAQLLVRGIAEIENAPFFGNGYRHIQALTGQSTHNELIENLVNFGLCGFVAVSLAFGLLYLPASAAFVFLCIIPSLIFSHNFFDNASLQIVIGMALSIARAWSLQAKSR